MNIILKQLGKNTIVYSICTIALRASSIVLIPLYTHILSVKEYGILATLLITIQLVTTLISMGMRDTIIRFNIDNKERSDTLIGSSLIIVLITSLLLIIILNIGSEIFYNIIHNREYTNLINLCFSISITQAISLLLLAYLRAENNVYKYLLFTILTTISLIILSAVFLIIFRLGLEGALLALFTSYFLLSLYLLFFFIVKIGLQISFKLIRDLFLYGFPILISLVSWFIMESSTIYFLNYYHGSETVAIYSLGYKFASLINFILILPFNLGFPPFIFSIIKHPKLKIILLDSLNYLLIAINIITSIVIIILLNIRSIVAPIEYSEYFSVFILLLPAFLFLGLYIFGQALIQIKKKTKIIGICSAFAAVIHIVINIILVPKYAIIGSIIATVATFGITSVTIFLLAKKCNSLPIKYIDIIINIIYFAIIIIMSINFQNAQFTLSTLLSLTTLVFIILKRRELIAAIKLLRPSFNV